MKLDLAPPLRRQWSVHGEFGGTTVATADAVATYADDGGGNVVCYDRTGQLKWKHPGSHAILALDQGILWTSSGDAALRLRATAMTTGAVLKDAKCEFRLCALVPERGACIGFSQDRIALVSLETAAAIWTSEALKRPAYQAAVDKEHVFTGDGGELLALSLDDGSRVWATSLEAVGGGLNSARSDPMVDGDTLMVSTANGPAAYSSKTGKLLWLFNGYGNRALYGGKVHLINQGREYCVLALRDGRVLLRVHTAELVAKKWGITHFDPGTWPLVSETHLFLGDGYGRLYAFDVNSGEPVWHDHPKNYGGYLLSRPALVGRRIYITTYGGWDTKRTGALHCYEAIDEAKGSS